VHLGCHRLALEDAGAAWQRQLSFFLMTIPCVGVLVRRFPLAANHSRLARPPAAAFSWAEALESRNMGMHLRIRQRQEAVE